MKEPDRNKLKKDGDYQTNPINEFLSSNEYEAVECRGAGNCFFLSVSFLLGPGSQNSHAKLRKRTCDYMERTMRSFQAGFEYENNPKEYIKDMRKLSLERELVIQKSKQSFVC